MDLTAVILFLVMYYIRPQEWSGVFAHIHFVQLVMIMALASLLFRERSLKLGDLLKTPHDWMMLFFFGWVVLSSGTPWSMFWEVLPLAVFYIVIVQTLTTVPRMKVFVGWWTFLIVAIAALAIASEYGFDPLNGYDVTHGKMKGRLILNLWIFNNPNALGHNVVPCIPMLYFFAIWKRPLVMKEVGVALMIIPLWCIYLTMSKGAFLVGALIIVATLIYGRPKAAQLGILIVAVALGGTLLYKLPRMNELEKSKTDQAIQGRVAAFTHGLHLLENSIAGCGHGNWMNDFYRAHRYHKACHSSYVQIGGELGLPGFALFFAILYCNLRTLITAKTDNPDDERIRRTLSVLVFSYMASSWMVDFGFRPTFFMFSAAIAAFHRHLYGMIPAASEKEKANEIEPWRARLIPQPALAGALAAAGAPAVAVMTLERAPIAPVVAGHPLAKFANGPIVRVPDTSTEPEQRMPRINRWTRLGLVDVIIISSMTFAAIKFWAMMIKRM